MPSSGNASSLVEGILHKYDIRYRRILEPQKGYRNQSFPVVLEDGQTINCIIYKAEPGMAARIRRANQVGNYLATHGFPARATYDKRIVAVSPAVGATRYSALYRYLPGTTIPWEGYTKDHIKLLGKTMSDMHALLATMHMAKEAKSNFPQVVDEYLAIIARMQRYFVDKAVASALAAKLSLCVSPAPLKQHQKIVIACSKLPGQQVLHMDFVRSNILFGPIQRPLSAEAANKQQYLGDWQITGVLDFEKTAIGHPLFDVARTLAFLIIDCKYKQPEKIRKYFLYSGYAKRGATPYCNIHVCDEAGMRTPLLDRLTDMFLLYDFYKFLRHNPYEYLSHNEHFVRTRDALLDRGSLSWTEQAKR